MIEFRDSKGMLRIPSEEELQQCEPAVACAFRVYADALNQHNEVSNKYRDAYTRLGEAKSARDAAQSVVLRMQPTGEAERIAEARRIQAQWKEDVARGVR
jgi:hypothetical protein